MVHIHLNETINARRAFLCVRHVRMVQMHYYAHLCDKWISCVQMEMVYISDERRAFIMIKKHIYRT